MVSKNINNKQCAPKLIFFKDFFFLERFERFLMLKIDFENQILALFDLYFWSLNKSQKKPIFLEILGTKVVQFSCYKKLVKTENVLLN